MLVAPVELQGRSAAAVQAQGVTELRAIRDELTTVRENAPSRPAWRARAQHCGIEHVRGTRGLTGRAMLASPQRPWS